MKGAILIVNFLGSVCFFSFALLELRKEHKVAFEVKLV